MSNRNSTENEWLAWIEEQKVATRAWLQSDLPGAIETIDRFLATNPPLDLRRQAIGFRGSLHQEQGDLAAAKSDFLAAQALAERADFERCTLEESAGDVSHQLGDIAEAERWYLEALRTAAADPRISGGGVLVHLLKLRGEKGLNEEEGRLAEKVVKQSWHLLGVEGEPDLADLQATAKKLIEAQGRPFSADRPPSPKAF